MASPKLDFIPTSAVAFVGEGGVSEAQLRSLIRVNPAQTIMVNLTSITSTPIRTTYLGEYTRTFAAWTTPVSTSSYIQSHPEPDPPFEPPPATSLPIWGYVLIAIAATAFGLVLMSLLRRHLQARKVLALATLSISPTYNPRDFGEDHAAEWVCVENDGRDSQSQLEAMYASWIATRALPGSVSPQPEKETASVSLPEVGVPLL
ncbi:hypothetical protein EV426DRAFT_676139 [Tirmania nivea]|nr:hypothetical protein EV426DRAFT_676139 [Tirmania nivea]